MSTLVRQRTRADEADLRAARSRVHRLETALHTARIYLTLHEAARSKGERPPEHTRGLREGANA